MAEYEWGLHRFIRCSEKKRTGQVKPGQAVGNITTYRYPKKKGGTHSCNLPKRPYKRRRPFHATSYTHIRFLISVLITNKSHTNESQVFFLLLLSFHSDFSVSLFVSIQFSPTPNNFNATVFSIPIIDPSSQNFRINGCFLFMKFQL